MPRYALEADNSENMEKLRNARSYNDLVLVLMSIKTKATAIHNKAVKATASAETLLDDKSRLLISQLYQALFSLFAMELEVLFAKSLDSSVIHDSKKNKAKILLDVTHNIVISAENVVYTALSSFLQDKIPSELGSFVATLKDFLTKILTCSGVSVLNLPSPDSESYYSYLIFKRIYGADDFIISDSLFCIKAISNRDGSFSYTLSFPTKIGDDDTDEAQFSNQRKLLSLIKAHLVRLFELSDIKQLSKQSENKIKTLVGVHDVDLSNGILSVKLASGLGGREINNIISKLLSILTTLLGIDDPYKDVIHRMSVLSDGTKTIQFMLMNKTFRNTNALDDLRRLLNLKRETFQDLKTAAGVK
jgi:hypothetical protein